MNKDIQIICTRMEMDKCVGIVMKHIVRYEGALKM